MRCTSPIYRRNNNYINQGGKGVPPFLRNRKFLGFKDYNLYVEKYGLNPSYYTRINCGQCLSCRIKYAREWAERCYLESLYHNSNYFVTLTYDDAFLPLNNKGVPTLKKEHLQKFIKDLRNHIDYKIRFFGVGEYGDSTFRPHIHLLLFGLELEDLTFYKQVRKRNNVIQYFNSEFLSNIWKKGFVVVNRLCPETCAYCARYSLKKVGFKKSVSLVERATASDVDIHNDMIAKGEIEPIFSLMSRRPGIAREYYEHNKFRIYINDNIPMSKLKTLRYFDKLFEVDAPDMMQDVKDYRLENVGVFNQANFSGYDEEDFYDVVRTNQEAEKVIRDLS